MNPSHAITKKHFFFQNIPHILNLTDPECLTWIWQTADAVMAHLGERDTIETLEHEMARHKAVYPPAAHLAVKLARSRNILTNLNHSLHLSVVFAVYKEHTRIQTPVEHPYGEDFLMEKIRQMSWLCRDLPNVSWDMIVVDDGCPMGSGQLAEKILASRYSGDNVHVLFLQDAIRQGVPVTMPMSTAADSRKGGSIIYGLWEATRCPHANHVVLYTDADLSSHLGQSGLLVEAVLNGADVAIGSRREPLSVVIKQGMRNVRGKLFIYLWKRMLPNLENIVDTQCGFKLFRADVAQKVIQGLKEKQFAFDIELLLKAQLNRRNSIVNVPMVWIDSNVFSTTADLQPYLSMLKSIAGFYQTYLSPNPESESFALFVEQLHEENWKQLLNNIPPAIADREPMEFEQYNDVSVEMLAQAAGIVLS